MEQKMDAIRYSNLCSKFRDTEFSFTMNFLELTTMLGAIRLMQDHPDFQEMGIAIKGLASGMRGSILETMLEAGVPPKDVHAMDVLYSSADGVQFSKERYEHLEQGSCEIIEFPSAEGDE